MAFFCIFLSNHKIKFKRCPPVEPPKNYIFSFRTLT